ncbi:hypothetical protein T484DRAFT_1762206 [Baffinella frigidus]|nr:hypothetical protein T484DRAFT_1762206 [Cryptophyta sp. CCMP2293]
MSGPEAQQGWNLKSSSGREGRLGLQKRLREKCLERVKKDRSKLMAQLRSIGPAGGPAPGGAVQMMETLAHSLIQQAQAESSSAAQGTHAAGDDSMDQEGSVRVGDGEEELDAEAYMQLMRQVEEDVIAELLQNEAADDRQLLEYLEHERQELAAAAAEHTEEDSTVCPVCMSGPLRKHFSTFYCPCGAPPPSDPASDPAADPASDPAADPAADLLPRQRGRAAPSGVSPGTCFDLK